MHKKRITIATYFTLARIVLTPVIVVAMIYDHWILACCLFVCAALTDMIDGFLARYLDQKTALGAFLDPVADKILLLSCFFSLAFIDTPFFHIPHWFFYIVCIKEIVQIVGALVLFLLTKNSTVEPTLLGKATTCLHIFFIVWLFVCYFFHWEPVKIDYFLVGLLSVFVGMSFVDYLIIGIKRYRDGS